MPAEINIRLIRDADWPAVWEMIEPIIRAGESYPYAMDMTINGARQMWLEIPAATYVAEDADGRIVGSYYLKPNQPSLGAHVANCGYMVSEHARGMGVASRMGEHSQREAIAAGYRAMQFNLVVKTNAPSVHVWQKQGFEILCTLPGAFHHRQETYVDAYIMFKTLVESES